MGVTKGDRVAVLLPNRPQAVIAFFRYSAPGAVAVEHNPLYTEMNWRNLSTTTVRVSPSADKIAPTVVKLRRTSDSENVVSVDITKSLPKALQFALRLPLKKNPRATRVHDRPGAPHLPLGTSTDNPCIVVEHPRPKIDDPALMPYTSGTTGTPKVVTTHFNLFSEFEICRKMD